MKLGFLCALLALAFVVVGCADNKAPDPGYTKDDFAKAPRPAGYGAPAAPNTGPGATK